MRRALATAFLVVAAGLPLLFHPTAAVAASAAGTWISLYESPGEHFYAGTRQLFEPGATTSIAVTGTPTGITVNAAVAPSSGFTASFAPINGNPLAVGYYPDARTATNTGHPSQSIAAPGVCYSITAEFQILDIAFANGSLTRLDLAFDQQCETNTARSAWIIGEVSFNEPSSGPLAIQSGALMFPAQYVGVANMSAPLTVTNTTLIPVPVGQPSPSGPGAGDIVVNSDTCPPLLGPGASCSITVSVTPEGPGFRQAAITVATAGSTSTISVSDTGISGNAAFVLDSMPGEELGGGDQVNLNQFNSTFFGAGDTSGFNIGSEDNPIYAGIGAPPGQALAVGTYPVERTGYQTAGKAGVEITVGHIACGPTAGQMALRDIAYDLEGRVSRFAADIQVQCADGRTVFLILRFASTVAYSAIGIQPDPGWGPLTFPSEVPGNTSSTQTVTVTNAGVVPLTVSPAITGANPGDFTLNRSSCASPLSPRATCSMSVAFAPHGLGTRTASLVLTDGTARGQHSESLIGPGVTAPTFTFPVGTQILVQTTQPVTWVTSPAAQGNYLVVGTSPGAANLVNSGVLPGNQLSYPLPPVMAIGGIYATIFTEIGGKWSFSQSISFSVEPPVASFTYPQPGLPNVDATRPITWTTNGGDQGYYLVVGTTPGSANLVNSGVLPASQTSFKPPPMPADTTLYATLFTELNGAWNYYQSITFIARSWAAATFTSPLNSQRVTNMSAPYTWTTVSFVQGFYLVVGTTPGSANILNSGVLSSAPNSFRGVVLPKGVALYAIIFTEVAGSWAHSQTITFTAG